MFYFIFASLTDETMFTTLISLHSILRWLVLMGLIIAIIRAYSGAVRFKNFSKTDNAIRHWTATIAHIQLALGIILYTKSPITRYFWKHTNDALANFDSTFFALLHAFLMFSAVVLITVGSSLAKRRGTDQEKFRTMLLWFSIALLLIFIAIPWPFSPLSSRPYLR